MKDVLDELAAAHRVMGKGSLPAGEAYTVELRRRYDAEIEDVWDAITNVERLRRWLKPGTGDLRPGGKFELEGGEHGEILRCEQFVGLVGFKSVQRHATGELGAWRARGAAAQ